jgi:hypothetical protein
MEKSKNPSKPEFRSSMDEGTLEDISRDNWTIDIRMGQQCDPTS